MTDARALRTALMALHKELLEAQRIQALQDHPGVVLAHRDVVAALD
jgi:hypothetical protein